jgi:glycosyltransferase involved in cell wall biosynthesis
MTNDRSALPPVTIGLPTFNGEKKIEKAVRSVLDQCYPNLEIVISDNASTDNTGRVCEALARRHPCISYFAQEKNIGMMPNFEFVLKRASSDLFMWLSDDDYLEEGILFRYVSFLSHHPDYVLVSGAIRHWIGGEPAFSEKDFTFSNQAGVARLLGFYYRVVYGSVFYGMMRRPIALQIPLRNRIGDDWHFVASVAYLGKVKSLDCVGYNKNSGGISKNFQDYARNVGSRSFTARYPHVQIAFDAFSNIFSGSPVYARQSAFGKMALASMCSLAILLSFYGKQYPYILGGRIKRLIFAGNRRQGIPVN